MATCAKRGGSRLRSFRPLSQCSRGALDGAAARYEHTSIWRETQSRQTAPRSPAHPDGAAKRVCPFGVLRARCPGGAAVPRPPHKGRSALRWIPHLEFSSSEGWRREQGWVCCWFYRRASEGPQLASGDASPEHRTHCPAAMGARRARTSEVRLF